MLRECCPLIFSLPCCPRAIAILVVTPSNLNLANNNNLTTPGVDAPSTSGDNRGAQRPVTYTNTYRLGIKNQQMKIKESSSSTDSITPPTKEQLSEQFRNKLMFSAVANICNSTQCQIKRTDNVVEYLSSNQVVQIPADDETMIDVHSSVV
jgi:hypothetical protein